MSITPFTVHIDGAAGGAFTMKKDSKLTEVRKKINTKVKVAEYFFLKSESDERIPIIKEKEYSLLQVLDKSGKKVCISEVFESTSTQPQ